MSDMTYGRDASWNRTGYPSGFTLKKHFPHPDDFAVSACRRVALDNRDHSGGTPVDEVPEYKRCRAPGCRERWS